MGKIKITIECEKEDLISILMGNVGIAMASEGEGGTDAGGDDGSGSGDTGNSGDDNNNNNNTGRPGVGTGMTGPGRPSADNSGNN